ncbi:MAG: sulfatase [Planctomycetaceae bacterium]
MLRSLVTFLLLSSFFLGGNSTLIQAETTQPNIIIIFCDDLGYGDLGCFGHPTIQTPNLDRMASEGMKLTQFYSAAPVCTPSRAALMTGRLPVRTGMCSNTRRVLFPDSAGGIQDSEILLPEALKAAGYATGCFGKWHLGHLPQYLPTNNGFDEYFGIPYSNDMDRVAESPQGRAAFLDPKVEYWNNPILRGTEVVERPSHQPTLTKRYTAETIRFITENQDKPFFVYLPHSMPHIPLFRSEEFANKSRRGLYGDVIEELDWSVGQILQTLREQNLDHKTVVFFTSDNGPWTTHGLQGGSAGLLRDGKGSTWEGGMREPCIAWWPGTIPAGTSSAELGSTMDLYVTSIKLAGGTVPEDRPVDGYDLTPVIKENSAGPRDIMYYYRGQRLMAIRKGPWKAHFMTQAAYGQREPVVENPPVLYHLEIDPSEQHNVSADHPEVIAELARLAEDHKAGVEIVPSQLEIRLDENK